MRAPFTPKVDGAWLHAMLEQKNAAMTAILRFIAQ